MVVIESDVDADMVAALLPFSVAWPVALAAVEIAGFHVDTVAVAARTGGSGAGPVATAAVRRVGREGDAIVVTAPKQRTEAVLITATRGLGAVWTRALAGGRIRDQGFLAGETVSTSAAREAKRAGGACPVVAAKFSGLGAVLPIAAPVRGAAFAEEAVATALLGVVTARRPSCGDFFTGYKAKRRSLLHTRFALVRTDRPFIGRDKGDTAQGEKVRSAKPWPTAIFLVLVPVFLLAGIFTLFPPFLLPLLGCSVERGVGAEARQERRRAQQRPARLFPHQDLVECVEPVLLHGGLLHDRAAPLTITAKWSATRPPSWSTVRLLSNGRGGLFWGDD
jgi:hypothetical protein